MLNPKAFGKNSIHYVNKFKYRTLASIFHRIFKASNKYSIEGEEKLKGLENKRKIVILNHLGHLDPFYLSSIILHSRGVPLFISTIAILPKICFKYFGLIP